MSIETEFTSILFPVGDQQSNVNVLRTKDGKFVYSIDINILRTKEKQNLLNIMVPINIDSTKQEG
jgi:hypothetical protein